MSTKISKDEVLEFQKAWADNVVKVGQLYLEKKDYKNEAVNLVNNLYGYNEGTVLFKPTRAQYKEFRLTAQSAVSYFVGQDDEYSEDTGFALQPWVKVRFVNSGFILDTHYAITMGTYFFTDLEGREKKVEFSFGLFRTDDGKLKINLHHSSIPYLHPKHNPDR
uniref:hypothetical protein n=1 Tax=uncultured Draconibacterium sp. TaxID=1573823 RepID=UPI0032178673